MAWAAGKTIFGQPNKLRKAVMDAVLERKSSGLEQLHASSSSGSKSDLAEAEDITAELLETKQKLGPALPFAQTRLIRGAVNSFQSWQDKYPTAIGLVLGKKQGGHFDGLKVIVSSTESAQSLLNNPKIQRVCREEAMLPCGLILGEDSPQRRQDAQTILEQMIAKTQSAICMFVSWNHELSKVSFEVKCDCACMQPASFDEFR